MIRKLLARDTAETHRVATPLELLFDLSFVVAVAQAAASLHHAVSENHAGAGLLAFGMAFFALWLPWLNFTWFASAFDNDDTLYRIITMFQIAGVLVIAAGIPAVFEHQVAKRLNVGDGDRKESGCFFGPAKSQELDERQDVAFVRTLRVL